MTATSSSVAEQRSNFAGRFRWVICSLLLLGFSSNILTLPSDMFPANAVASAVGLGGMAGSIGGLLIAKIVSYVLQWTGSYTIPFLLTGSAYLFGCW